MKSSSLRGTLSDFSELLSTKFTTFGHFDQMVIAFFGAAKWDAGGTSGGAKEELTHGVAEHGM